MGWTWRLAGVACAVAQASAACALPFRKAQQASNLEGLFGSVADPSVEKTILATVKRGLVVSVDLPCYG